MMSCDTNILVYALHRQSPEHATASAFIRDHLQDDSFAISEHVLAELYNLLRNPSVFTSEGSAKDATEIIQYFRGNPYWTVLRGDADIWNQVWRAAAQPDFPRRAVFDARLAFSLAADGVTRFATRNTKDFARFNVFDVFDPINDAI
jgi:toxin-antitoxin system PIN domain toxin